MDTSANGIQPLFKSSMSPEDISNLNEITLDKSTKKTFEQVAAAVRALSRSDTAKLSLSLSILLKHNHLNDQRQVLNILFSLFDLSRCEPKNHPYLPVFVERFNFSSNIVEKHFISLLLGGSYKELAKKSATEVLNSADKITSHRPLPSSIYESLSISSSIPTPKKSSITPSTFQFSNTEKAVPNSLDDFFNSKELVFHTFEPQYIRTPPPLMEISNEFLWLNPEENREMLWDHMMGMDHLVPLIQQVMRDACQIKLSPEQAKTMSCLFFSHEKLVFQCGMVPDKLPGLIENNQEVASDFLSKILVSPLGSAYYSKLASMKMSLPSMEIVNRLTGLIPLPQDFVEQYVLNCIQSCRQKDNKRVQDRLVRLVSVFLKALVKNNTIDPKDNSSLIMELQSFCVEHSKIKEANELFRTLCPTNSAK